MIQLRPGSYEFAIMSELSVLGASLELRPVTRNFLSAQSWDGENCLVKRSRDLKAIIRARIEKPSSHEAFETSHYERTQRIKQLKLSLCH
jgi:hypothetical protein